MNASLTGWVGNKQISCQRVGKYAIRTEIQLPEPVETDIVIRPPRPARIIRCYDPVVLFDDPLGIQETSDTRGTTKESEYLRV